MAGTKTVGIRELKNNLSAYLREVRRGARILVSDRSSVVAELREPGALYGPVPTDDPVIARWIREGLVTAPTRAKSKLEASPVSLAAGTSERLLAEDRDETGR
jgi:antitoxin (DNA-binding transcriptional repressor) of toxin-antitoxin stability system